MSQINNGTENLNIREGLKDISYVYSFVIPWIPSMLPYKFDFLGPL